MESLTAQYQDEITLLNSLYPLAAAKPNARYVGEIFAASDQSEVRRILEAHSIRFNYHHETKNPLITDSAFAFSFPSDYTGNWIGYCQTDFDDISALGLGQPIQLPSETRSQLDAVDGFSQGQRLTPLVMGLDHMATRVLAGEREGGNRDHTAVIANHGGIGHGRVCSTQKIFPY